MLGGRCEHVTLSLTLGVLRVAGIVGKFRANMARNQRHDDRWCEFIAFDVGQKNRTIQLDDPRWSQTLSLPFKIIMVPQAIESDRIRFVLGYPPLKIYGKGLVGAGWRQVGSCGQGSRSVPHSTPQLGSVKGCSESLFYNCVPKTSDPPFRHRRLTPVETVKIIIMPPDVGVRSCYGERPYVEVPRIVML